MEDIKTLGTVSVIFTYITTVYLIKSVKYNEIKQTIWHRINGLVKIRHGKFFKR